MLSKYFNFRNNVIPCIAVYLLLITSQVRWAYTQDNFSNLFLRIFAVSLVAVLIIPIYLHFIKKLFSKYYSSEKILDSRLNLLHLPLLLSPLIILKGAFLPMLFMVFIEIVLIISFFPEIYQTFDQPLVKEKNTRLNLKVITWLLMSFMFLLFIKAAWVTEDAYITFRTIDNFFNGYGLRWNVNERVQVFTHPLWMMFISLVYSITHEIFISTMAASILLTFSSVLIVRKYLGGNTSTVIPVLLALMSSKAFVDYSSSGLENPLSYFILSIFYVIYFTRPYTRLNFIWLALLTAIAALNRHDSILFYLFPLGYFGFRTSYECKIGILKLLQLTILCFLPIIAWTIFSLVYYGFPFPNTAYAKLNTGIPDEQYIYQGILYYLSSISDDILTLSVIFTTVFLVFFLKEKRKIFAVLSISFFLCYILKTGGDFMSGRFFALAFFACCALIIQSNLTRRYTFLSGIFIVAIGLTNKKPTLLYDQDYDNSVIDTRGVADERGYYYGASSLLKMNRDNIEPQAGWVNEGKTLKGIDTVIVSGHVGFRGYYAGPTVHIIDPYGLTDVFIAQLNVKDFKNWRIGHFNRMIPSGYAESVKLGKNLMLDSNMRKMYDVIRTITKDDIWSANRFMEILKINLGYYRNTFKNNEKIRYFDYSSMTAGEGIPIKDSASRSKIVFFGKKGMQEGFMPYGPYITIFPGKYKATFMLKTDSNTSDTTLAILDVVDHSRSHASRKIKAVDFKNVSTYQPFDIVFETKEHLVSTEFRIFFTGKESLYFDYLKLDKLE